MDRNQITTCRLCYHYENPSNIYIIIGIAKTDDVFSKNEFNRKCDFFARDFHTEDYYIGYLISHDNIVISLNRQRKTIGEEYVLYVSLTETCNKYIWAHPIDDFLSDVYPDTPRFTLVS